MLFKKMMCYFFGHKRIPNEDFPLIQVPSQEHNGNIYVWTAHPCTRCVVFNEYHVYSKEQWDLIIKERTDKYFKAMEKTINNLVKEIDGGNFPHLPNLIKSDKVFH